MYMTYKKYTSVVLKFNGQPIRRKCLRFLEAVQTVTTLTETSLVHNRQEKLLLTLSRLDGPGWHCFVCRVHVLFSGVGR